MNDISIQGGRGRYLSLLSWHWVLFVFAVCMSGSQFTDAQSTFNWIGSGQTEEFFHVNSNWLQNEVPGPSDVAQFNIAFAVPITINFDSNVVVDELQMLKSDYTFRGFDFVTNQPSIFDANFVDILGDSKLTLERGPDDLSFQLNADRLSLAGEINVVGGTKATFDKVNINTDDMDDPGLFRVVGQNNGTPSSVDADELEVGSDTLGKFRIEDGAVVVVGRDTELGQFGGRGELVIDGTDNPFQTSRLSTNNFIAAPDSLTQIIGDSELFVAGIMLIQESFSDPGLVEVISPEARLQINDELRLGGGNVLVDMGATLATQETTIQQFEAGFGFLETHLNIQSADSTQTSSWINSGNVYIGGSQEIPAPLGGEVVIDGGNVQIDGVLKIWDAGRLRINESNDVASRIVADSIDNSLGGLIAFDGGTLSVNYFEGALENFGGTLAPGDDLFGKLPGRTVVAGDCFQYSDAALAMDLGGPVPFDEYDVLEVGGFMLVDGQLELTMQNGFRPSPSEEFVLVSSSNVIGSFANVESGQRLTTEDGSGSFRVDYGFSSPFHPGQIVLSDFQEGGFLLGDINGDGTVNLLDVAPFVAVVSAGNFVAEADINGDGMVNLLDVEPFVILLSG